MTRRNWKVVAMAAAGSLVLSACSIPIALSQTRTALSGDPFTQVHFTVAVKAPGAAAAQEAKFLKGLTFSINAQSTTGAPLASSLNHANQELTVWRGPTHIATLSDIKSNLYLDVNIAALEHVPGVTLSASEIAAAELFLGGRWIEFPYSLVSKYSSTTLHLKLKQSSLVSAELKTVDALVSALAGGKVTTTATGVTEAGTLASIDTAIGGLVNKSGVVSLPSTLKGNYSLAVTKTGAQATGFNFSVTTPYGKLGDATVAVVATITHHRVAVKTPANPLVITSSLINQLGALASGTAG